MEELDVIVVGGGIGGLTAAAALLQRGHRVRVFDQVRELRPVGAGISLWSNGVKVLDALGLGPDIAAVGGAMERLCYRDRGGQVLCDFSLAPLVERVGEHPYPVRRSDLQALLLRAVGDRLTTGARCTAVEDHPDHVVVRTEAGEDLVGDLVVIADGTHSALRAAVVGAPVERTYVGYHNLNGIVPDGLALGPPTSWTVHVGDGQRASTMPVRDGQYFFFDVLLDDPAPSGRDPRDLLREHFAGWGPTVHALIDGLDPAGVAEVAIHTHAPVERFARGRAVVIGDAAHTSAPDLGQGGCLAMEDAWVLATTLTTNNLGVVDALERYSGQRVPRAASIVTRALTRARLTHSQDPERTDAWYAELASEDGSGIIDGISTSILGGPLP